jgi:hypothetical protein
MRIHPQIRGKATKSRPPRCRRRRSKPKQLLVVVEGARLVVVRCPRPAACQAWPVSARADWPRARDCGCFADAVLESASSAITPIAEAWAERIRDAGARGAAAVEFLELVFEAGGVLGEVTMPSSRAMELLLSRAARKGFDHDDDEGDDPEELEALNMLDGLTEQASEAFQTGQSFSSCLERSSQSANRKTERFIEVLRAFPVALGEAAATSPEVWLLVRSLVDASQSAVTTLRLAATTAAMAFGLGFCRLYKECSESAAQAESEGAKRGASAAGRGEAARSKSLRKFTDSMQARIEDLREAVFANRFRDTEPRVRAESIALFGRWLATCPELLVDDKKAKYLGWALHDRESSVREAAAGGIALVFQDEASAQKLVEFWGRFSGRVRGMLRDVSPAVVAASVRCFTAILPWEMLTVEDVLAIETCLFESEDVAVRRGCGEFLMVQIPEFRPLQDVLDEAKRDAQLEAAKSAAAVVREGSSSSSKGRRGKAVDVEAEAREAAAKAAEEAGGKVDVAFLSKQHRLRQLFALTGLMQRAVGRLTGEAAEQMRLIWGPLASNGDVAPAEQAIVEVLHKGWSSIPEVLVSSLWGTEEAAVLQDWAIQREFVALGSGRSSVALEQVFDDDADHEDEDEENVLAVPRVLRGEDRVLAVHMIASALRWAQGKTIQPAFVAEAKGLALSTPEAVEDAVSEVCGAFGAFRDVVQGEVGGLLALLDLADSVPSGALGDPANAEAARVVIEVASDMLTRGQGAARPGWGARVLARLAGTSGGRRGARTTVATSASTALKEAAEGLLSRAARATDVLGRVLVGDVEQLHESDLVLESKESEDVDMGGDRTHGSDAMSLTPRMLRAARSIITALAGAIGRLAECAAAAPLGGAEFQLPSADELKGLTADPLALGEHLSGLNLSLRVARSAPGSAVMTVLAAAQCLRLALSAISRDAQPPMVLAVAASGMDAARGFHAATQFLAMVFARSVAQCGRKTLEMGSTAPPAEVWEAVAPTRALRDVLISLSSDALDAAANATDLTRELAADTGAGLGWAWPSTLEPPAGALLALAAASNASSWRLGVEVLRLCPPSLVDTGLWALALPDTEAAAWAAHAQPASTPLSAADSRAVLETCDAPVPDTDEECISAARIVIQKAMSKLRENSRVWQSQATDLCLKVVSAASREQADAFTAHAAAVLPTSDLDKMEATATVGCAGFYQQPADRASMLAWAAVVAALKSQRSVAASKEDWSVAEVAAELDEDVSRLSSRLNELRIAATDRGVAEDDDAELVSTRGQLESAVARHLALADADRFLVASRAESIAPLSAALATCAVPPSSAVGASVVTMARGDVSDPVSLVARAALKDLRSRSEGAWVEALWGAIRSEVDAVASAQEEAAAFEEEEEELRTSGRDRAADISQRKRRMATQNVNSLTISAVETARQVVSRLGPGVTASTGIRKGRAKSNRTLVAVVQQLQKEVASMLLRPKDMARARTFAEARRAARGPGADIFVEEAIPDPSEAAEEEALLRDDPGWGTSQFGMGARGACAYVLLQRIKDPRSREAVLSTFRAASLGLPRSARLAVLYATDPGSAGSWIPAVQLRLLLEGNEAAAERIMSAAEAEAATPGSSRRGGSSRHRAGGAGSARSNATPSASASTPQGHHEAAAAVRSPSRESSVRLSQIEQDEDDEQDDDNDHGQRGKRSVSRSRAKRVKRA